MKVKKYTVIVLFNGDGSKVLLQTKDRTTFAGKLNGVGGKVEPGETPYMCAIREIKEETTLREIDIENFTWLGTLTIPEQCDMKNPDFIPELFFCGGIVRNESKACKAPDATEEVKWYSLRNDNTVVTDLELAGDGDLQYFISRARKELFGGNTINFE